MRDIEFIKQIGTNLRKIRTDRSLSRPEVAKQLNITIQTLINIEVGKTDINVSRLKQFSDIYNIHLSEIFSENSPIAFKMESIRAEMKEYQKKYEKSQQQVITLQQKVLNSIRDINYVRDTK